MKQTQILRIPDAIDGATEVDPLSQAAGGIDTSFPLLAADRICRFKIASCTKQTAKSNESSEMLVFKLKTEKDYTDRDGKVLRAGFSAYHRITITPSEPTETSKGRTIENIAKDLATALKATGKTDKSPRDLINNPSMLDGEIVDMKVSIDKARGSFPESNSFRFVIPG